MMIILGGKKRLRSEGYACLYNQDQSAHVRRCYGSALYSYSQLCKHMDKLSRMNNADTCSSVSNLQIISCPSAVRSCSPLTIHCNHCVFSVIFRELARVRPLYDTVNFNCLGLSALTPVQPPEGTRELMEGAHRIEWEKATVVRLSSVTAHRSASAMKRHKMVFCKLFDRCTCRYALR